MGYCEDCGTKFSDGTCPNCQEELFIYETQYKYMINPISDKFTAKINKQKIEKNERLSR